MSITNTLKRAFGTSRSRLAKVPTQNLQEANGAPRFPAITTCPAPTCVCRPTPALDIDARPFDRTVAPYTEHVLVHTGVLDWPSRIENDARNAIPRELRELFKPGSRYHDPYNRVLVSNSSIRTPTASHSGERSISLLKSGRHVKISANQTTASLVEEFLSGMKDNKPSKSFKVTPISEVTVLICGHGNRDMRCGVMGPLLEAEFEEKLPMFGYRVLNDAPGETEDVGSDSKGEEGKALDARIGLVSHVGGHAFAGNVIIYVPRTFQTHPLAGLAVWYGRVEPRHVEGIVQQTLVGGKVIQELLRGTI